VRGDGGFVGPRCSQGRIDRPLRLCFLSARQTGAAHNTKRGRRVYTTPPPPLSCSSLVALSSRTCNLHPRPSVLQCLARKKIRKSPVRQRRRAQTSPLRKLSLSRRPSFPRSPLSLSLSLSLPLSLSLSSRSSRLANREMLECTLDSIEKQRQRETEFRRVSRQVHRSTVRARARAREKERERERRRESKYLLRICKCYARYVEAPGNARKTGETCERDSERFFSSCERDFHPPAIAEARGE